MAHIRQSRPISGVGFQRHTVHSRVALPASKICVEDSLSSEYGTCKRVKARLWQAKVLQTFEGVPSSLESGVRIADITATLQHATLEAIQGQILSQSPTDATSGRKHLDGS